MSSGPSDCAARQRVKAARAAAACAAAFAAVCAATVFAPAAACAAAAARAAAACAAAACAAAALRASLLKLCIVAGEMKRLCSLGMRSRRLMVAWQLHTGDTGIKVRWMKHLRRSCTHAQRLVQGDDGRQFAYMKQRSISVAHTRQ